MPYIITTGLDGQDTRYHTRRAVATLDEARAVIRDHVVNAGVAHGTTADPIAPAGGTVGPLPDGSVIEVEEVAWEHIFYVGHPRDQDLPRSAYGEFELIDAYNAAQA